MKNKQFSIIINSDKWIVMLMDDDQFDHRIDHNTLGITYPKERIVVFREQQIKKWIVTHEITHAYFSYTYFDSAAKVRTSDAEELICEFVSDRVEDIRRTSNDVFRKLKKL